jgi:hypothetical protein
MAVKLPSTDKSIARDLDMKLYTIDMSNDSRCRKRGDAF